MSKYTIQDAIEYAHRKGGQCMSTNLTTVKSITIIMWQCNRGHTWNSQFRTTVLLGYWCRKCDNENRRKYSIEDAMNIAKNRNGICLSDVYTSERKNMKWKCNVCQTEWKATLRSIVVGSWCPHCAIIHRRKVSKMLKCPNCHNDVLTRNNTYCSFKCKTEYEYNQYIQRWKSGQVDGTRYKGEASSIFVRKYLQEKYGNKCCKCGWCEMNIFTEKIPLHIHHIDGNWKNNIEENLELLCPNCHSLTSSYGSMNKGNGRPNKNKNR